MFGMVLMLTSNVWHCPDVDIQQSVTTDDIRQGICYPDHRLTGDMSAEA